MQSTVTDEVSAIGQAIAARVGTQKYRIWFKNSTKLALADGYLKVGVANLFVASWLENHFLNEIIQAGQEVTGHKINVSFTVAPELSGQQGRSQFASQRQLTEKIEKKIRNGRTGIEAGQNRKLKLGLETFVVGRSNELAYNAAKAVIREEKSPFNPLFVHGGYGVGKTHLLQGICNAVSQDRPQAQWLYLSAEDFVNQFVLALKTKKLEAFRSRIRQTDLLAIDDIHFLASKPSTQEEFLHTFNTIDLAGRQVVMGSDAHPKMIGQLSEKLVNRFISGMVVKINPPDLQTRCQICKQYIRNIKAQVPEKVIRYVAEHLRTNVRELEGALLKLTALSSLGNQKIDLNLAKQALTEHLARTDPMVHISDIESAVAAYFGITPANIHSSRKGRTVAMARHFSMYLARKHTKMSSSEVGRVMGNKNHATVLLACKKLEDLIARNIEMHWQSSAGNRVCRARKILAELEESFSD
ncbi:MAG: chromosomal replication initiator protein DnaA [Sedimentisphaerales bacterium]|nr:chromosomal replication initiator protein DnaA [Sedimentisphaerales bacterium]